MDYDIEIRAGRDVLHARASEGTGLLEVFRLAGARIPTPCGGKGTCGKCQFIPDKPADYPPNGNEERLLSAEALQLGVRLACGRTLDRNLRCSVPALMEKAVIATSSTARDGGLHPDTRRYAVTVPAPSLDIQLSDEARLLGASGCSGLTLTALRGLGAEARGAGGIVTVTERNGMIIDVRAGALDEMPLGVAVDIGTTTLAAYLMDLSSGRQLAVASRLNPQKTFGDDVITRSDFARQSTDGLGMLQKLVSGEINAMIGEMCAGAGVRAENVFRMTAAGNTVMMHLFLGVSPADIAVSPFIPAFAARQDVPARQAGIDIHPEALVSTLPCISGYVGADTVAVALASEMLEKDTPCLVLDIGTNGEILLGDRNGLIACSTAAGPAFEGAHIRYGMGGVAGAISKVAMDGCMEMETIYGKPAMGICGSAIVDLTAGLLRNGALDETGFLEPAGPSWLKNRFVREESGWALKVSDPGEGAGREIYFTQRDIREVQLAKAAIAAGIDALLRERGMDETDVGAVYLAGGFGSFIDPVNACRIGLIPASLLGRIEAIGNAAGAGARRALLSTAQMEECDRIRRMTDYIELSARPDFQNLFVENMIFTASGGNSLR